MSALALVVEDEIDIAEILDRYLKREGFRTARAGDGQNALELHALLRPDVVLLDVGLPRQDGWAVLSEIRRTSDTPVIMMTALDQDIDKLQALRMGADDYVVKPFNPSELVARAQAILRRSMGGKRKPRPAYWPAGNRSKGIFGERGSGRKHGQAIAFPNGVSLTGVHGASAPEGVQPQRTGRRLSSRRRRTGPDCR